MATKRNWIRDWRGDWERRSRSGAAAVEFALVLPLFLLLLFGIMQFGTVMFLHNNMVNAAREAARRMSVAELDKPQAEAYARNYLAAWNVEFEVTATPPAAPNGEVSVVITVLAADAALVNFPISWPGNLVAEATMRSES